MRNCLKLFLAFSFLSIIIFQGCSRDELVGPGSNTITGRGVYVLSEGNGSPSSVALSYFNITDSVFTQNILSQNLGSYPDGLIASGNYLFMTAQGNFGSQGKIYRSDLTGNIQASNDIGINPYSLTEASDKLYLTNGPASNVSVVNKNSLSLITTIPVGAYPQEIITFGTRVFVCNTSLFGGASDSTVSVIDSPTDQVVAVITVQKDPSALAVTNDGKLLIGCPGANAYIFLVDPSNYSKLDSFLIPDGCYRDISLDNLGNAYFVAGGFTNSTIKKLNLSTGEINDILLMDPNSLVYYGLKYDSTSNRLFLALANSTFSSYGELKVLKTDGTVENVYSTNIGPRRVIIK